MKSERNENISNIGEGEIGDNIRDRAAGLIESWLRTYTIGRTPSARNALIPKSKAGAYGDLRHDLEKELSAAYIEGRLSIQNAADQQTQEP